MNQIENIIHDKGSKYSVSGGCVKNREEVTQFLKQLTRKKKYARATHNTWAVIFSEGERLKNDDGENGAGIIILNHLAGASLSNHLVVVTRWYGGVHLGADRFRHVRDCTKAYIKSVQAKEF